MPSSGFAHESNYGSAHFIAGATPGQQHAPHSHRHCHDEPDRDRQMAKLVEADIIGARTKKPNWRFMTNDVLDSSGLTDAHWAEINKLRRAHEDGGQDGLSEAMS